MVRQGLWPVIAGVGIGLVASFAASRVLRSVLFEIQATDSGTFAGTAAILTVLGALAPYIRARRATRIAPAEALRAE